MADSRPTFTLRLMTVDDITQVISLDRLGFPIPWSRSTYLYELQRNTSSTLIVLEQGDTRPYVNGYTERSWLSRLVKPSGHLSVLVGYSGFWQIEDEAHVSTITVHPDWRGNKLGDLLLWKMISMAIDNGADKITLEVRVSNEVAIALYQKYGFQKVGKRRGYYRDNGEDAAIMMVEPLDDEYMTQFDAFGKALYNRAHIIDLIKHPEEQS